MQNAIAIKYIIAALAAVALVGGGATVYMKNKAVVSGTGFPAPLTSDTATTPSGMSLKDLLSKSVPSKCTVTSTNDMAESSGVVYIADGKMRSDFTNTMSTGTLAGKVMVARMIVDTDTSYMWGEGAMKMGIKMAKNDILDVKPGGANTPQNQAAMDMNEKSDYHCDTWKVDTALFIPPSSIEFQDMSAMMKQMPQIPTGTSVKAGAEMKTPAMDVRAGSSISAEQMTQMCGACDSAGDGKAQCRAALGCK